jgi:hypothetical protein
VWTVHHLWCVHARVNDFRTTTTRLRCPGAQERREGDGRKPSTNRHRATRISKRRTTNHPAVEWHTTQGTKRCYDRSREITTKDRPDQ